MIYFQNTKDYLQDLESIVGIPTIELIKVAHGGNKMIYFQNTKDYLEALESVMGIPITELIKITQGGNK